MPTTNAPTSRSVSWEMVVAVRTGRSVKIPLIIGQDGQDQLDRNDARRKIVDAIRIPSDLARAVCRQALGHHEQRDHEHGQGDLDQSEPLGGQHTRETHERDEGEKARQYLAQSQDG